MKLLFTEEVTNEKELEDMLQEKEISISNYHMFLLQNSSPVDMLLTEEIEKESKYISS